jgi:hypothetical protein
MSEEGEGRVKEDENSVVKQKSRRRVLRQRGSAVVGVCAGALCVASPTSKMNEETEEK